MSQVCAMKTGICLNYGIAEAFIIHRKRDLRKQVSFLPKEYRLLCRWCKKVILMRGKRKPPMIKLQVVSPTAYKPDQWRLSENDSNCLDELAYLNVRGDAKVPQERKEKMMEVLTDISGEIKIMKPKGATLEDKPDVKITRWMLEQQPLGLYVSDCAW